ncbi:MAG: hypothetical protein AB4290_23285 [Spirulina sp.]
MQRIKLKTELDNLTLLELFWTEPKIYIPQDGYSCYELKDNANVILEFGVNTTQESVELKLKVFDTTLLNLSYEQVKYLDIIDINKGKFSFSFTPETANLESNLQIELRPKIQISGSTVKTCG